MPLLIAIVVAVVCCVVANRVIHKLLDLEGVSKESNYRKSLVRITMIVAFVLGFVVVANQYIRPF
ncbi:MAG: hypothetical protein ACR2NM_05320 [Bythopirellula sp.]